MAANMEALATAAREFLGRCRALLSEDSPYPVDINSVRAIEQDLQLSVVAIRQYYNASPFAPINRLHPELLSMIFQLIRQPRVPATPGSPETRRFGSYKPLVALTLVCHKWHRIITDDSSLWNEADLINDGNLVQHLLERSKAASLHVRFAYPGFVKDGRKVLTSFLKNHAHRFRELEVKLKSADRTSKMLPLLDVPMPRLRCLVISLEASKKALKNAHAMSFKRFPALKALALSGTILLPKEPVLSLTHLHIVALIHDSESILPLMNVLRATPTLEVLDLRAIRLVTENIKSPSVTLPRLRALRISDYSWCDVIHFLLCHMIVPNLAVADFSSVTPLHHRQIEEYIPQSFLDGLGTMTRLRVEYFHLQNPPLMVIFENADFKLTLRQGRDLACSVLASPPMLRCLDAIEDMYFDVSDAYCVQAAGKWLAARLSNLTSLVMSSTDYGIHLLQPQTNEPVVFPRLVSLGLGSRFGFNIDAVDPILEERAKIVGGPLPVLRVGSRVGSRGYKGLDERLKGPGGIKLRKCVGSLEVVQLSCVQDSLWASRRAVSPMPFMDHGYWTDSNFWNCRPWS